MLKTILLHGLRLALQLCYLPFRLLRPGDKIVFISRQADRPGMDFLMLAEELRRSSPDTKVVMLCRMIPNTLGGKLFYILHMFRQMYHLATARAVVLDGYCIAACLLKHHKQLKIYQLWHALGLLKNFGYTALGTPEGSSPRIAEIFRMHRGYHRIFCSAPDIVPAIAKCYDAPEEIVLPIGLPRIDFLTTPSLLAEKRRQILELYPALADEKPVILYVPTFRRRGEVPASPERAIDLNRYHLVIKGHDDAVRVITAAGEFSVPADLTGLEWLAAASFVVTDYSAILFEAFTAGLPVCLYCGDRSQYDAVRGLAIDYDTLPAPHCQTPQEVADAIDRQAFDREAIDAFCETMVAARHLHTTKAIAHLIRIGMQGETPAFEEIKKNSAFVK